MRGWAYRAAGASLVALMGLARPAAAQLPAPAVIGSGPFQVGGYAAVTLGLPEHPEDVEQLNVSELAAAALAWGQITPRLSYLVELDMATRTSETWTGREADHHLVPVRLYLEYTRSDLVRVRLGRFLTPIGQWNERHAEPLTWSPTRPLSTYRPFAKSLTGLLIAGQGTLGGHDAGYALFWAPTSGLDGGLEEQEESSFVYALGARVAAELHSGLTLGFSVANVRQSRPRDETPLPAAAMPGRTPAALAQFPHLATLLQEVRTQEGDGDLDDREEDAGTRPLLGADFRWEGPRAELLAEGTWLLSTAYAEYEGGAFVQGALRLHGPLWFVGRAETYQPVDGQVARLGYAGLTVRYGGRLVVKLGRQFTRRSSERIPDGWFLSLSSLF